jgi:predicted RNase H-like nuclease (RuvC/YqgF family)
MWKRLSVFFVLLVLAGFSAGAFSFLPIDSQDEQIHQLKLELESRENEIRSQMGYIEQLEKLSSEQVKDLDLLVSKLEQSEARLKASETKSENLQRLLAVSESEIESLKTLSSISKTDSETKQTEIADLTETVVEVETENVELYKDKNQDWGGLVGGSATWDPTSGRFGATVDMGVRYKNWALVTGVEYKPSEWKLALPQFSELLFSTGVQWQF